MARVCRNARFRGGVGRDILVLKVVVGVAAEMRRPGCCGDIDGTAAENSRQGGAAAGPETVIESGLNEGDFVVTDGHLLLTNGARGDGARAQSGGIR
jgi:hypothetical protein